MAGKDLANELNALLGPGTVRMGDDPSLVVRYLPTTVLPIDVLLQGGLPRGRATEIYGDYSTLKSFVALAAIANAQRLGETCCLIDTEHSFDPSWAATIGVNVQDLIYQTPRTGEEAVDLTEQLASRGDIALVVWDSVAATLPGDEAKKRMAGENMQPARLAALMSAAMRKITAANSTTALLFINQTRLNVGMTFGNPEVVPGGRALPFYASYRVSLRKAGKVTREGHTFQGGKQVAIKEIIGFNIRATVEKSKLSSPHRDVLFMFDLERGEVDNVGYLITLGLEAGIIKRKGTTQWVMGSKTVSGAAKFQQWVTQTPTAMAKLQALVAPYSGVPVPAKRRVVRRRR